MADVLDETLQRVAGQVITGRQEYHLEVFGAEEKAQGFSVVSCSVRERMGEPVVATIVLTHPNRLSRKHFLGKDAKFSMSPLDGTPHCFSGFIASYKTLKTSVDFTKYEIELKSHLGRLEGVSRFRIYQHQTTPEIVVSKLREHGIPDHLISVRLRGAHPQHAFRFQYGQSDLAYVQMLCQKAGIYLYIQETEYGDQIVLGDDIDHYIYDPELNLSYREVSGQNAARASVYELSVHATTVAKSFAVAEYNPDQAYERFFDEANVAPEDPTTYGTPYAFGTGHRDFAGAKFEAQLRHEEAIAWQVVIEGNSTELGLQTGRVFHTDETLDDAPDGLMVIEVTHTGARNQAYTNAFKAIPADRRFRLRLETEKWPRVAGTLSARVTSPDRYKYAFLNAAGYYTVRFDFDFDGWPKGGESVPLRLVKPFAGALQTGFHFPTLDNTEAMISFRDGDPDKPEISGFHHHSQAVDLVTSDRRWISRGMIRTQSNNKLRFEDWQGQEGIKLSTEHSGKSQLNLGYLVDNKLEKRGEGFELRSSGYGAVRSGKGLLLSTDDQPDASGKQLDMQEAMQRLEDAYGRMEGLSQAAQQSQAESADLKAMSEVQQKQIKDMQEAVMLLSSKSSIAMVSPDSIQHSAGANLAFTAGDSADVGVLRRFRVFAGEMISLFAHHMGMKLYANHGKISIQAQNDEIELTSQQNMTVTSSEGHVVVQAGKSLTLTDGGGAYIKLENGQVTIGSPGQVAIKMANFKWDGPDSIQGKLPGFSTCHASNAAAATSGENSGALT
ncbi:type VI secretion system tip protein VgrG [Caballeronia sp. LZ025]|uniref:type VI secretion system Vgr family protein n=1 Tax=Caballeronia TaxID=1827195 RepID=UPI001FD57E90|nr:MULTISPECIES: type VI secretion system Vgr family protein [Caballeronia]MDR5735842.1 type VI secretion system tip protein VgrG [Caballeronia sp. LZ025]